MTDLKNALSLLSFLKSLRITYFSHLLRFIETKLNEFTQNANLICQKINIYSETSLKAVGLDSEKRIFSEKMRKERKKRGKEAKKIG